MADPIERALRKFKATVPQLQPRPPDQLPNAAVAPARRSTKVLLDTNVLIELGRGTLPPETLKLIQEATIYQSSVCRNEACNGLAYRNEPLTPSEADFWRDALTSVPEHRLITPDDGVWTFAGLVAGRIARSQHYQVAELRKLRNDALIYISAAKAGVAVLTRNRVDFDLLQQATQRGTFYWY